MVTGKNLGVFFETGWFPVSGPVGVDGRGPLVSLEPCERSDTQLCGRRSGGFEHAVDNMPAGQ